MNNLLADLICAKGQECTVQNSQAISPIFPARMPSSLLTAKIYIAQCVDQVKVYASS